LKKRREGRKKNLSLSLWLRLLKSHNLVMNKVRPALSARGITLPQFDVLAQLSRSPGGLTFSELSEKLLVSAGNLTGIVRRLEREKLVSRAIVPQDRRSFTVSLTPTGKRRIHKLIEEHRQDVGEILSVVPRKSQASLRRLLGEAAIKLGEKTQPGPAKGRKSRTAVKTRKKGRSRVGSIIRKIKSEKGVSRARRAS
jgi:DNA-binding MarR family transcriptional regulator